MFDNKFKIKKKDNVFHFSILLNDTSVLTRECTEKELRQLQFEIQELIKE